MGLFRCRTCETLRRALEMSLQHQKALLDRLLAVEQPQALHQVRKVEESRRAEDAQEDITALLRPMPRASKFEERPEPPELPAI